MVSALARTGPVIGPVAKGKEFIFAEVKDAREIDLDY